METRYGGVGLKLGLSKGICSAVLERSMEIKNGDWSPV